RFTYGPYVHLGQGVNFAWFWQALTNGTIVVDPACNMSAGRTTLSKARYQFRCSINHLASLYPSVTAHDLRHVEPDRNLAESNLRTEGLVLPPWMTESPHSAGAST